MIKAFLTQHRLLAVLLLITFIIFSPCLDNRFVYWDDIALIEENTDIHHLTVYNLKRMFTNVYVGTYIPLTVLSFAIEHKVVGLNPFLYHLNNILLHLGVVLLVYFLVLSFGLSLRAALIAAALFAIHPLNTESVAWASQRKDVLFTFFYLLALLGYGRYLKLHRPRDYIFSVAAGMLSILAKPMAYSLPAVLFICDYLHKQEFSRKLVMNKIPYVLVMGGVSAMTLKNIPQDIVYSWGQSILIWIYGFIFYLKKFIMPIHLDVLYEMPQPISLFNMAYVSSLAVFVVLCALLIIFRKNRLFVGAIIFYAVTISVLVFRNVWNFGNNTVLADRFMYLPKIGLCIYVGYAVNLALVKYSQQNRNMLINAVVCAVVVLFGIKSFQQCGIWQDNMSLWTYTIDKNPRHHIGYVNRGTTYLNNGEYNLALADYQKAFELNPKGPKVALLLGNVYERRQLFDQALVFYRQALALDPHYANAYFGQGKIYYAMEDFDSAIDSYTSCLALEPGNHKAHYNLGLVYDDRQEYDQAIQSYSQSLEIYPQYSQAFNNRGYVYLRLQRFKDAIADFDLAIRYDKRNAQAYNSRGTVYFHLGKYDLALADFEKALIIDPSFSSADSNKSALLQVMRKAGERR